MPTRTRLLASALLALSLAASACGSSDSSTTGEETTDTQAETTEADGADVDAATPTSTGADNDVSTLFIDGALTSDATVVDCTLENGSETNCYQLEVASLSPAADTDGPFCPATTIAEPADLSRRSDGQRQADQP